MTDKPTFPAWLVVAVAAYLIASSPNMSHGDDNTGSTECSKALEQYQYTRKSTWIETEKWILAIASMLSIKMSDMENEVASYEVGRANAAQIALSQASKAPECKDDRSNE